MLERERRAATVVETLAPNVRGLLLKAIMAPPAKRAELIALLHEKALTPGLVELIIDLEQDRSVSLEVAAALKAIRDRGR
jgi:hypothetical protein